MRKDPTEFRARFKAYKEGKSVKEIYDGGYIKEPVITPDPQYNEYINSLPDNQRLTPEASYRSHRYWELNGKPKNFAEAIGKGMFTYDFKDNGWHAKSVALNENTGEYEFMKPNWHDTKMYEDAWYYSKEGEQFRQQYTKKAGAAYDKYIPRYKNGRLPKYSNGRIGHNVSRAEMNDDGTFTDDYTKVFEDMYVTPQKTDLKRGSYTLNNFPYYLQHRTDWVKPFMSSGTNEKGLELIYPEFDILSGVRVLQQMSKPFAKIQQAPNIQRKYDNVWDKHYFKALQENDIKGAQNLREAHFRINAPNTKVTKPQYHTVDDQYNPKYNSFDKDIENLDASFYTSDNPYVSGTYSKELVSEAERDYIIETTRQQQLKQMLSYRNEQHLTNPHYWELVDPNKFRQYALKTFKWLDTPVNPDRQKKVYLNIKNPFEIDAKGKHWSQFEFEDFPKAMQEVMLPNGYSIYRPWSTRSIEAAYPKLGYDSAVIQNLIDLGGNKRYVSKGIPSTIIETKNPNNIKYVDAVTYDDSGNIIPLSERDNFNLNDFRYADGKLPGYKNGKIRIKPANRGKFTALKKRTGHSTSWFKENGTPAQKKMAVFAMNAKKWKH